MTSVRVILGYFHPWPNDAGTFLARQQGRYAARGLDVSVAVVDPGRGDTLAHLARGEADFGIVPSNRLLAARARGQRVVAVAAINQVGLETLHGLRSRGLTRPRDLTGRTVALSPTPRGLAMVRHLVDVDGGDSSRVTFVDSGPRELLTRDLERGDADAYFGAYWSWDQLFDDHPLEDRISWPVKDHGAPAFHSYLLVAQADLIDRTPEVVGGFVGATGQGYRAAAADLDAAAEAFGHITAYFPPAVIARSFELVSPTWFHEGRWGTIRDELVVPYAHWLHAHGALDDLAGLPGATTTRFLAEAA
jgi:NitT/TauT family transport system substrate-binding protein